ncbi:MAG TPA: GYF domain-containing protein, partial [Reyranella sp.]|nr:GYF domain-containing protein [Reyranella sp.]
MTQWYFHIPGQADRLGPFDDDAARRQAQINPRALAWREGMSGWSAVADVAELRSAGSPPPPPLPGNRPARADDIDFQVHGHEMQFVEIELDPGESAIAEAGALMFKDSSVQMDTVFGDGRHEGQGGGFMDKLMSAGKRVLTGE